MIAIIDYGAGNLRSVNNAITRIGYRAKITNRPEDILQAKAVFLPGVGAAGDTMTSLQQAGFNGNHSSVSERKPAAIRYLYRAADSYLPAPKKAAGMNV